MIKSGENDARPLKDDYMKVFPWIKEDGNRKGFRTWICLGDEGVSWLMKLFYNSKRKMMNHSMKFGRVIED